MFMLKSSISFNDTPPWSIIEFLNLFILLPSEERLYTISFIDEDEDDDDNDDDIDDDEEEAEDDKYGTSFSHV